MNRRLWGPLLSVVLILGVGAAIYFSVRDQISAGRMVTVRGLIGSEKEEFFQDERVVAELRTHGLTVIAEKAGSRQIATSFDLSKYDFGFPGGIPAAEKLRREQGVTKSYDAFFTPMTIATWKTIADVLVANGVATDQGGYYTLNLDQFLQWMEEDKRWSDLQNNPSFAVNKSIVVSTSDVRKSNSPAMFLALSSYVLNGDQIVQNETQARPLLPSLSALFLEQGFLGYSSEEPFEDYLVMGMGKAPLVFIYESQFIARAAANDGSIAPEMVLIYPEPTIFTKHVLVPFTESGERLGEALLNDPELQRLEIEYGFRNTNLEYFREFVQKHTLTIPTNLVNVVEPPSYEVLEGMIVEIEKQYEN